MMIYRSYIVIESSNALYNMDNGSPETQVQTGENISLSRESTYVYQNIKSDLSLQAH